MIEFNGHISGNAEKHFWKKSRKMVQIAFNAAWFILFPVLIFFGIKESMEILLLIYGALLGFANLLLLVPKTKRHKLAYSPRRIYIENDCIWYITNKGRDSRNIEDVKVIYDYGDFYDFVFPFGKVSEYFVCQKNLLSKGTLEEFESLFIGKIERKS